MAASLSTTWSMTTLRTALPLVPSAPISICLNIAAAYNPSYSKPRHLRLSTQGARPLLLQYSGPTSLCPLLSVTARFKVSSLIEKSRHDRPFRFQVFAMRHGRRVPKLNRPPDQRRALLRGLTTQLLKHGRIRTTKARASAVRKYVDKMITLAKEGTLHKRRQALGFIYEKQIVHAMFAEVQDRYGDRNGGYTRIIRTLPRRGDNAPMAYIELV